MGLRSGLIEKQEKRIDEFLGQLLTDGEQIIVGGTAIDLDAVIANTPGRPGGIADFIEGPIKDALDLHEIAKMFAENAVWLVAVTNKRIILGQSGRSGLGPWTLVATFAKSAVHDVGYRTGLNQTLQFSAGTLAFKGTMGRWYPKQSRYADLEAVARALESGEQT